METGWIDAETLVVFFTEDDGTVPIVGWLAPRNIGSTRRNKRGEKEPF